MKHYVIYVPGVGDSNPSSQRTLVKTWRLWGARPYLYQMNWGDGKPFGPKLDGLLQLIDQLKTDDSSVSLVGASAGAGAVINAFAARKGKITGVVCICGKVNNAQTIGPGYSRNNPAFIDSANQVQPSLDQLDIDKDRPKILSRYAVIDPVVPQQDSVIAGAVNKTVPSFGHSSTIATQLLFGAPTFLHFLKNLDK